MPKVAVIGGSGVYDPQLLDNVQDKEIETIYGKAKVAIGTYKGIEVAFMARHGSGHSVPPGKINYRANIQALKDIGVEHVISTSAVGSLQQDVPPGTFVLLNNFLDFTKAREATFFDGGVRGVAHVDVTNPYCPTLGPSIFKQAKEMGINILETGTYVCCEGPRYETGAEVKLYSSFGGTVVGMTNVPECVLAREAELCYQTICIVTNYAAGISPTKLTHKEVVELMAENIEALKKLVFTVIENIDMGKRTCSCATALEGASG
jgi:5'-methylthioadenosine phosphorylase